MKDSQENIEVSIVLPCLNEEKTISQCVKEAKAALTEARVRGEVVIADNGSTDKSVELAKAEGGRIVHVKPRGYGNALYHGLEAAKGEFLIFLDADLTYEFSHIPRFIKELQNGAELVMGSRLRGKIEAGAMPPLHRYLGTPALTLLARIFFGAKISDINCGMRGLSKKAFHRLRLQSGGMEFASEMIMKASMLKMTIVEIPTHLKASKFERVPHLSTFRDGWRHLRFMLLFTPTWLFYIPGSLLSMVGLLTILAILLNFSPFFGLFTCLAAMASTHLGLQLVLLGLSTRVIAYVRRYHGNNRFVSQTLGRMTLERGLIWGASIAFLGICILACAFLRIYQFIHLDGYSFGQIDLTSTKLSLLGATLFVCGSQVVFTFFFLGFFGIQTLDRNSPNKNSSHKGFTLDLSDVLTNDSPND